MKISFVFRVKICYADVFILGFLKFLFPVCFFWLFLLFGCIDYQYFTILKQILKKKIMMVVCAGSFSWLLEKPCDFDPFGQNSIDHSAHLLL